MVLTKMGDNDFSFVTKIPVCFSERHFLDYEHLLMCIQCFLDLMSESILARLLMKPHPLTP